MVITGDQTQIDLPKGVKSGLLLQLNILQMYKVFPLLHWKQTDVVSHPLMCNLLLRHMIKWNDPICRIISFCMIIDEFKHLTSLKTR